MLYAEGSDLAPGIHNLVPIPSRYFRTPDDRQGVQDSYFTSRDMKGEPLFTRTDDMIDFYWDNDSPHPQMPVNDFGIHWVADLVPRLAEPIISGPGALQAMRSFLRATRCFRSTMITMQR